MKPFSIKNKHSVQHNYGIDDYFYINDHEQIRRKENFIDCFGSNWGLFFPGDGNIEKVQVRSGLSFITLNANDVIFCPPFSILESKIPVGTTYRFKTITSSWPLQGNYKDPVKLNFKYDFATLSKNRESVLRLISGMDKGMVLKMEGTESPTAMKLKKIIDKNFTQQTSIKILTHSLNVSRESAVRFFKKTYGLNPSDYLMRLKIYEALFFMFSGLTIIEASNAVGFSDPSRFINNFKKLFGVTPKHYKLNV